MRLVFDAEAIVALLASRHPAKLKVREAVDAAKRLNRHVMVATVTLAELCRGVGRSRALDSWLAREGHDVRLRDTDLPFARLVGSLLNEAGLDSVYLADAHVVAAAIEDGGGTILTADPKDLRRLAAPYRTVVIEELAAG